MKKTIERPGFTLPGVEDITRRDFLVGGAAAMLLGGCGSDGGGNESSDETKPFEHAMGTTEVPVRPERLVALHDLQIFESLRQLGYRPIASTGSGGVVQSIGNREDGEIEYVGETREPNLERIAALSPDLIVGDKPLQEDFYDRLSEIAPTVMLDSMAPAEGPLRDQRILANLVGSVEEFERLKGEYDARVDELRERLAPLRNDLEVSYFYPLTGEISLDRRPVHCCTKALSDLGIRLSRGMLEYSPDDFYILSYEEISNLDADVIFVQVFEGDEEGIDAVRSSALFTNTFAYRRDQAFEVNIAHWGYPSILSLSLVLDDIERYVLDREIDTSGDFR